MQMTKFTSANFQTRILQNAVSHLSVLCHKIELNAKTRQKFMPLLLPPTTTKQCICLTSAKPGHVAQLVGHLTRKSGVLGSIPGLATYFRFSFRFYKKGSCQLLAKVCA